MVAAIKIKTENNAMGAPAGILSQNATSNPQHPERIPKKPEKKNIFFRS